MRPAKHDDLWTPELQESWDEWNERQWIEAIAGEKPGMFSTWFDVVKFMGKMMGVLLLFALAISGVVYLVGTNLR